MYVYQASITLLSHNVASHVCEIKGAFVLGENDFRKSFSPKFACLAVTENDIFRKMTSG